MAHDDPTLGAAVRNPSWRPTLIGSHYAVSTGHYLASAAAFQVLARGGNAIDAGVTASMALAVLQPDMVSFAGVAPTLVYLREENRVVSLAGLGYWPAATDKARLIEDGGTRMPDSLLRTVVPAAPAAHIEALKRYGTISFAEAATPAMAPRARWLRGLSAAGRQHAQARRQVPPVGLQRGDLSAGRTAAHRRHAVPPDRSGARDRSDDRRGVQRERRPRSRLAGRARLLLSRPDRRRGARVSRAARRLHAEVGSRRLYDAGGRPACTAPTKTSPCMAATCGVRASCCCRR